MALNALRGWWLRRRGRYRAVGALAITAAVAFLAGVILNTTTGFTLTLRRGQPVLPPATALSPSAADTVVAPETSATVVASAPATASLAPPASQEDREPPDARRDDAASDDGTDLPKGWGYLLVESTREAQVYTWSAVQVGATGEKARVPCGNMFVRLGTAKRAWLAPGRLVFVRCQALTTVKFYLEQ
jgi:hypothetical protein